MIETKTILIAAVVVLALAVGIYYVSSSGKPTGSTYNPTTSQTPTGIPTITVAPTHSPSSAPTATAAQQPTATVAPVKQFGGLGSNLDPTGQQADVVPSGESNIPA